MERITVRELERHLARHKPRRIVFSSDNQTGDDMGRPVRLHLCFPVIMTALNPDAILLRNGESVLRLNNVDHLLLDTGNPYFDGILHIFCKDNAGDGQIRRFTLVLD